MSQVVQITFVLFIALTLNLLGVESHSSELISVKDVVRVNVPTPLRMALCKSRLLVVSASPSQLQYFSDPISSERKVLLPFLLSSKFEMSAISCWGGQWIAAYRWQSKGEKIRLGLFDLLGGSLQLMRSWPTPKAGHISDLRCEDKSGCYLLIDGKLYFSRDTQKWKQFDVPKKEMIPHLKINTKLNPFGDWHDRLSPFPSRYTRVLLSKGGGFYLLEPFASNLVIRNGTWSRWGDWGAWEGSFMKPKAIERGPGTSIFASDVGLESIFVFDKKGAFQGGLGWQNQLLRIKYPYELIWKKPFLFVSDTLSSEVLRLRLDEAAINELEIEKAPYDLEQKGARNLEGGSPGGAAFRKSLYQVGMSGLQKGRECLNCHDGSVTASADHFFSSSHHHPFKSSRQLKTDLPLLEDGSLDCVTCHDPHHYGNSKKGVKRAFLQKGERELCLTCHAPLGRRGNHPITEKVGCLSCHDPHSPQSKNLRQVGVPLCASCHQKQEISHPDLKNFLQTERAIRAGVASPQIQCGNCHQTHSRTGQKEQGPKEQGPKGLLMGSVNMVSFCSSCHGAKSTDLFSHFHDRMKRKVSK